MGSSASAATTRDPSAGNRLSLDVVPTHYALTIQTDLVAKTFRGTAEITINVLTPVSAITLNAAAPLVLHVAVLTPKASASDAAPRWREAKSIALDTHRERAVLSFTGGRIDAGTYVLAIRFDGKLDRSMKGYYLSAFPKEDGSGQDDFYAVTQFQPTSARRAFPCFDEPSFKATYAISMISRSNTVSISNMDMVGVEQLGSSPLLPRSSSLPESFFDLASLAPAPPHSTSTLPLRTDSPARQQHTGTLAHEKDTWEIVHFRKSPLVSSYLVVWSNGPFERREASYTSSTGRVVPLTFYATKDNITHTEYALSVTQKILPIYEKLFDIPFPLPKLDTLVISDFDLGAMEGFGLITGRTSVYLYDEKKSGIAARKYVASTVSHEISHQWFGNITTMYWWDNLWLNESFATLIGEVVMLEHYEPSWKASSSFISEHLGRALNLDAARSSHPIEQPCPDEATIISIFDAISYSKGGSVLKMLKNLIGEETFLKGVTLYLKAHLYGNAQTKDLWAGISESSGRDIAKIMLNWSTKIGFPLVTVEETKIGLKLRQNRFLNTADATAEENATLWYIPLQLKTVESGIIKVDNEAVLVDREVEIPVKDVANSVYKLNGETAGVYRVLYPAKRLAKLGDEAAKSDSAFSLNDRMGLVQDAAVLAASGFSRTSTSLTLISKLASETEHLVWVEIASALSKMSSTWWDQPEEDKDGIDRLKRNLFGPLAERLGFEEKEGESIEVGELRSLAIGTAAAAGEESLLKEYRRRFDLLLTQDDDSLIPAELRRSIFTQSVARGGVTEYEKILEIYQAASTPSHKSAAMAALGSPSDPELIKRSFALLSSGKFKSQDYATFFGGLASNSKAKRQAWSFFQQRYDEIVKRFAGNFAIASVVKASFQTLSSSKDAEEVEAFFKSRDTSGYAAAVSQGLDAVRAQAAWVKRDCQDVHDWLEKNDLLGN